MIRFIQPLLIPGIVLGLLALLGAASLRCVNGGTRRSVLIHLAITLALLAADWALLAALPALNLSYGVVQFPLLTLLGLRLLLFLGWEWGGRLGPLTLALNLLLTCLVVYAFYVEPLSLSITHLTLPAPGAGLTRPVRIVQLSDIHLEHPTRREAEALRQIQALQPDLIVITGDFLNISFFNNPQSQAELHDWLANLHAPAGVWAVSGTTDSPDLLRRIFSGTAVTLLEDAVQRVDVGGGQLALLGVTDINLDRDGQMLAALLGGLRADEFSLLLYHNPDLIGSARKRDVDLYLAGHTHGGQVRLPLYGALVTNSAFDKQFEMGLYYQLNTTLYINRGLGMEGSIAPRARLLCPPEIVVIDLQP